MDFTKILISHEPSCKINHTTLQYVFVKTQISVYLKLFYV